MDELVAQQIIVWTALVFRCQYTPPVLHTRCHSSANHASYNPDHWRFRHSSPFVLRNPRIDLRPRSRISRKRPSCLIWISRSVVNSPGILPQNKPRPPPLRFLPLHRSSHSRIRDDEESLKRHSNDYAGITHRGNAKFHAFLTLLLRALNRPARRWDHLSPSGVLNIYLTSCWLQNGGVTETNTVLNSVIQQSLHCVALSHVLFITFQISGYVSRSGPYLTVRVFCELEVHRTGFDRHVTRADRHVSGPQAPNFRDKPLVLSDRTWQRTPLPSSAVPLQTARP
jgi:hypothetical protein